MKVTIQPSEISGEIAAPASKSSMQRACAAALIRSGKTIIENPGRSNDDKAALDIIQKLGAVIIEETEEAIIIESNNVNPKSSELNCGESGLGIRMFTPIAALSNQTLTITGVGSLLTRPMDFFDEIFPWLSVNINSNGGKLPLVIKGPIQPCDIAIDGSISSQFLTGLLMAYSTSITNPTVITVTDLKSRPYIDLTLDVMSKFGMNVPVNNAYNSFHFSPTSSTAKFRSNLYCGRRLERSCISFSSRGNCRKDRCIRIRRVFNAG
jgi:3-phosphoshikimate 1-carboxyvinyltransferase